ncbi:L,D-transpeptidase family protein [Luteimonas aquatica]|uniref:L,D-transpeptidase family protein n=1 Tax=Luteimonas aquatica TaxID=450364 RepID=UPI001F591A01|nr:L,D-transpeptidase family protein [Luteimonas aquatica]
MNPTSASARLAYACLAIATLVLAACAHRPPRAAGGDTAAWNNATQMIVVVTADWNASGGTLRNYSKTKNGWKKEGGPIPVTIGRNGAAWGLGLHPQQARDGAPMKREGDGRAPAGVFTIDGAFGYIEHPDTALPYLQMQATSWCIDVPDSPLYNRFVDTKTAGAAAAKGSSEPMRLDLHNHGDMRYKIGFVIGHNREARTGAGSCIFAHLWKAPGEATAGCTAMDEPTMQRLYAWLRPQAHPVFVLLPQNEYDRLKTDWQLPTL